MFFAAGYGTGGWSWSLGEGMRRSGFLWGEVYGRVVCWREKGDGIGWDEGLVVWGLDLSLSLRGCCFGGGKGEGSGVVVLVVIRVMMVVGMVI